VGRTLHFYVFIESNRVDEKPYKRHIINNENYGGNHYGRISRKENRIQYNLFLWRI